MSILSRSGAGAGGCRAKCHHKGTASGDGPPNGGGQWPDLRVLADHDLAEITMHIPTRSLSRAPASVTSSMGAPSLRPVLTAQPLEPPDSALCWFWRILGAEQ